MPADAPDRAAARRTAYLNATRTPMGGFTEAHTLLIRDRHHLPDDLREPLEQIHTSLSGDLFPSHPIVAMALLDNPALSPREIDAEFGAKTSAKPHQAEPPSSPAIVHQMPPRPHTAFAQQARPSRIKHKSPPTPQPPASHPQPYRSSA